MCPGLFQCVQFFVRHACSPVSRALSFSASHCCTTSSLSRRLFVRFPSLPLWARPPPFLPPPPPAPRAVLLTQPLFLPLPLPGGGLGPHRGRPDAHEKASG